jgi:hypothetical protein
MDEERIDTALCELLRDVERASKALDGVTSTDPAQALSLFQARSYLHHAMSVFGDLASEAEQNQHDKEEACRAGL